MSADAWTTAAVLVAMMVCLATNRFPPMMVMATAVVGLMATGVLNEDQAFGGFGNSAPITVGAGAIIGELALLDRGPRTATVTATTDMTVLILEQRNFAGILDAVPALSHKLLAALASRIRDLDRQTFG